ncbi:calpain-like protein [Strigomonas culicis]|uniref:Calpain-like protein n=1 Tax=Strigomonas culicis TaxID=28005 RepID=S9TUV0_9TRYP|nr:calpain-like protein [Strigomonas culicis]|eukprot:EPY22192.1 calpain-like protein [Strigomonas culicis]
MNPKRVPSAPKKSVSVSNVDMSEERLIDFVRSVSDPEVLHVIYDYLREKPELHAFEQTRTICNDLLMKKERILGGSVCSGSESGPPGSSGLVTEATVELNELSHSAEEIPSEEDEFDDYSCNDMAYPFDTKFQFGEPSVSGFVSKVFKEGMLYRIIDDNGDYYFYNDTVRHIMMVRVRYVLKGCERVNERAIVSDAEGGRAGEKEIAIAVLPEETNFMIGGIGGRLPPVSAKAVLTPDDFISTSVKRCITVVNEEIAAARKALGQWEKATDQAVFLRSCVRKKQRFTDLTFRPCAKSLYRAEMDLVKVPTLTWRRPEHYLHLTQVGEARLFRGEISCHLVRQGDLLNHTVVASIAAVALSPDHVRWMFRHPVSAHSGKQERAVGAFTVRLVRNGWWTTIYVDNYLPACMKGPLFARCPADPRRLWVSLLEKAYAKSLGSYSTTCIADLMETISAFTGYPFRYITASWQAAKKETGEVEAKRLFVYLQKCIAAGFLIAIFTPTEEDGNASETDLLRLRSSRFRPVNGIMPQFLPGRVYFITDAALYKELDLRMVRLKNPWTWESQCNAQAERMKRWKYTAWYDQPDMSMSMGGASIRMANALSREKTSKDERKGTMWIQWDEALRAFEGGGVCYTAWKWQQYRVRGAFLGGYPALALEIVAHAKVEGYLTLTLKSVQDHFDENGNVSNSFLTRGEVCPTTLTVARASVGQRDKFEVAARACDDIECLAGKLTFVKASDVSIKASFAKSTQPYYVIPQMDPSYLRCHPDATDIPFVLSFLSDKPAGLGDLEVRFKTVSPTCAVFQMRISSCLDRQKRSRQTISYAERAGSRTRRESAS